MPNLTFRCGRTHCRHKTLESAHRCLLRDHSMIAASVRDYRRSGYESIPDAVAALVCAHEDMCEEFTTNQKETKGGRGTRKETKGASE